ncbi:MAG: acetylxylan esterase [Verrucomicrobia bacterium]|nr:acetylxylan esterase [Verrucomicrobiota bacterium]
MSHDRLDLSPSVLHRRVMDRCIPELAYTGGDGRAWQTKLRRRLRSLLGEVPKTRVPLRVRTLWSRPHPLGTIDKIVFTSEPGADVPAYVCRPANAAPPYTWMICLQGHTSGMHHSIAVQRDDEGQPFKVEGDRDFGLECMRRGVAALCMEQRAFGERHERTQTQRAEGCHDAVMQSLMLGRTLIGERVFDVDRGIDVLAARRDVDMKRIGVMGNSGGGTISIYAAALLPRIAFAMPSCCFCTFRDSIMLITHCGDNYIPGLLKVAEMADVTGLIAPKPLVLVSGKSDDIFPIKGVRHAFRDLKRIYSAIGAQDRLKLVIGHAGHRFYAKQGWDAFDKITAR